ncbi:MAG: SIMPL domain-containing protein [Prevotellaceae bacterium]|nr:SIMPL domain-containing protein [Prevotellaceae bacterium]MDD7376749.1 SIMPL domain-containing protein [Prevotellaceae bacterium]MDY4760022.1 SIMPL domain-containing protein [Bacteroidaceae bacterium]
MKNLRIESAILAVGLALLGVFVYNGINSLAKRDRVVSVRGLAEKEVQADRVIWPLAYKTVGDDLGSVYRDISSANKKIQTFLIKNGIKASDITNGAPQVNDLWTNEYRDNVNRQRYNATSVTTVSSSDVAKVRALMTRTGELLSQGIAIAPNDYNYPIQFDFTSLNKIKPQMIEQATKNAREAAEKFAKDSESKLGKIKSAQQGLFSIEDRDSNTPYIKEVRVVTTVDYYLDN